MKKSLALGISLIPAAAFSQEKPNIVFLFGDDYGRYASAYGEVEKDNEICKVVKTPNIDRVAHEGVLMTNCYVGAPSSTPCRSSLLSGQYFFRTGKGAILAGAQWDASIPSYPLILESNGYCIGFSYKVWSPGAPLDAPYGGERTNFSSRGRAWAHYSQYVTKAGKENYDTARQQLRDEVAGNLEDFLNSNTEGKPFCYWWGPTNTHRQWQRGSGKDIWGIDPDDLKGKLPKGLVDSPRIRMDFSDYLGECQAFDEGVGVILGVLEKKGLLDNTIIVISGDHGIPGFPRGKCNCYDMGIKVAMAIRYPKAIPAGRVVTDFVSLPDLAPTFLDYGGAPIPEVMTARSFRNVLESKKSGRVDSSRDFAVAGIERHGRQTRPGNLPYPVRCIVTDGYKYIRNFEPQRLPVGTWETGMKDLDGGPTKNWYKDNVGKPEFRWYYDIAFAKRPYEELYDLKNDPDETRNVAWEPKYQAVRKTLSDRLDKILTEADDPRMTDPGLCRFDTPEYTDLQGKLKFW